MLAIHLIRPVAHMISTLSEALGLAITHSGLFDWYIHASPLRHTLRLVNWTQVRNILAQLTVSKHDHVHVLEHVLRPSLVKQRPAISEPLLFTLCDESVLDR